MDGSQPDPGVQNRCRSGRCRCPAADTPPSKLLKRCCARGEFPRPRTVSESGRADAPSFISGGWQMRVAAVDHVVRSAEAVLVGAGDVERREGRGGGEPEGKEINGQPQRESG